MLGLVLHYFLTIIWGVCKFVIHKTFGALNIAWLMLAIQFPILFSIGVGIIFSDMKSEMASNAGNNPFAKIGAALMDTFSIDPGVIMWILMGAAVCGLVLKFANKGSVLPAAQSSDALTTQVLNQPEKLAPVSESVLSKQSKAKIVPPFRFKKWWLVGIVFVSIILIAILLLKVFGLFQSFIKPMFLLHLKICRHLLR